MNKVEFLSSANDPNRTLGQLVERLKRTDNLSSLAPSILWFIATLSSTILKDEKCKAFPELIALGFWLRKSNLHTLLQQQGFAGLLNEADDVNEVIQLNTNSKGTREALGLVVHFTPSNVDTMFIYSWVASLLLGNHNIVRVASKDSELQTLLLNIINRLFARPEFVCIAQSNYFIRFDKQGDSTRVLCEKADARVIWGGDASVAAILACDAPSDCIDLCFADKFSASIIANVNEGNVKQIANLLWRDTQPYMQQACSSPRVIYWLNSSDTALTKSKSTLVSLLSLLEQSSQANTQAGWHSISQANEHLVTAQRIMSSPLEGQGPELLALASVSGLVVEHTSNSMLNLHTGNGFFICKLCDTLDAVFDDIKRLDNSKMQTLSFHSVDEASLLIQKQAKSISGIDRIVPLGRALDFTFHWDGYDLLSELSRSTGKSDHI